MEKLQGPPQWDQWVVKLEAGNTKWNSGMTDESRRPFCSVGKWDYDTFFDDFNHIVDGTVKKPVSSKLLICDEQKLTFLESSDGLLLGLLRATEHGNFLCLIFSRGLRVLFRRAGAFD